MPFFADYLYYDFLQCEDTFLLSIYAFLTVTKLATCVYEIATESQKLILYLVCLGVAIFIHSLESLFNPELEYYFPGRNNFIYTLTIPLARLLRARMSFFSRSPLFCWHDPIWNFTRDVILSDPIRQPIHIIEISDNQSNTAWFKAPPLFPNSWRYLSTLTIIIFRWWSHVTFAAGKNPRNCCCGECHWRGQVVHTGLLPEWTKMH
jgi:hypothetical protein